MNGQSIGLMAVLAAMLVLFVWGRWRYDVVALAALLACVALGFVPMEAAFDGFGHPAVVTVAGVLVLSRALQVSGAVDEISRRLLPDDLPRGRAVVAITSLCAGLSAFMNNVGALALLMPSALHLARRRGIPPARVLMPMAFASILGGVTTLIGTPPNLVVSAFRRRAGGEGFSMFDFAPVGLPVALVGLAAILLFAKYLIPARPAASGTFQIEAYTLEARVKDGARAASLTVGEIETALASADAVVAGLVRDHVRVSQVPPSQPVRPGDVLVIEADPEALGPALASLDLVIQEEPESAEPASGDGSSAEDEPVSQELVVLPTSPLVGRAPSGLRLRARFGIRLLAVSRRGTTSRVRIGEAPLRAGDVLLLHGLPDRLRTFASDTGCLPLAERTVRLPQRREAALSMLIMIGAVAAAAVGVVEPAIAFAGGVLAVILLGVLPLREVYGAIDGPVIVLLAALIPVADAMTTTGAGDVLAGLLVGQVAQGNAVIALVAVLIVSMALSDVLNNTATAAVMCPVALGAAAGLGVSPDSFLMAVAIGSSCAFMTPIGHQNNTIILGPGGLRFGDFWRLGLLLEIVVAAVAVPCLLLAWPL